MKIYSVYFNSTTNGEADRTKIEADSFDDAYQQYIDGKDFNDFEEVVVSPFGWYEYIVSGVKYYKNPLYKPVEKPKTPDNYKQISESETCTSKPFYATSTAPIAYSEKLDKLIELQEKQLFWIRFFGIITVISMVFTFIYVLVVMTIGFRR